jgi:hypothetical protein
LPDPFLRAHRALPRLFLLSHPHAPLSIRDQIIRGRWLVDRLLDQEIIEPNNRQTRLLVVGAGVAGAAAAIRAYERGVYVKLVEKRSGPFQVQAVATTRWIDPAQYDWPADHWLSAQYNWTLPDMPLQFRADWANLLASRWTNELLGLAANLTYLDYTPNTECIDIHPLPPSLLSATLHRNGQSQRDDFAVVVWAGGFGDELSLLRNSKTKQVIYQGMPFWETDRLSIPYFALWRLAPNVEVLIAGAGDGALQDFMRITTRSKSAVEFYRKLAITPQVEQQIYSSMDHCQRNWIWGHNSLHDHSLHLRLDNAHQDVVETLLSDPMFVKVVDSAIPTDLPQIKVFYPGEHLTAFYGLNRFLARLIATFLNRVRGWSPVFNPGWRLVDVQPDDPTHPTHHCPGANARGCFGVWHKAVFREAPHCYDKTLGPQRHEERANVLIVRFGIDPVTTPKLPLPTGRTIPVRTEDLLKSLQLRHHLPYHILAPNAAGSWT